MIDGKSLSAAIRKRKKDDLRPDMDYAGQTAVDPNTYEDEKQATRINDDLGDPDHEPASDAEMGEHDDSQDLAFLKKAVARIGKYFESL